MKPQASWIVDYFVTPIGTIVISLFVGLWWLEGSDARGVIQGIFGIFVLSAWAYEQGYKIYYVRNNRKKYFIIVYVAPILFGILGFLIGFYI